MIEIGTRVEMDSYGETYTGTVVKVYEVRVARKGHSSGQGNRVGINTAAAVRYDVAWDGAGETGEGYMDSNLRVVSDTHR